MKKANILEPSTSPFKAPMVCVKKENGSLMVTIDFIKMKMFFNKAYDLNSIDAQSDIKHCNYLVCNPRLDKWLSPVGLDPESIQNSQC